MKGTEIRIFSGLYLFIVTLSKDLRNRKLKPIKLHRF